MVADVRLLSAGFGALICAPAYLLGLRTTWDWIVVPMVSSRIGGGNRNFKVHLMDLS